MQLKGQQELAGQRDGDSPECVRGAEESSAGMDSSSANQGFVAGEKAGAWGCGSHQEG